MSQLASVPLLCSASFRHSLASADDQQGRRPARADGRRRLLLNPAPPRRRRPLRQVAKHSLAITGKERNPSLFVRLAVIFLFPASVQ